VPFGSGSNACDAMVVIPCSMGTLGRIAHGYGEDVLLRAADVMLKEGKKLILVPRETPISLVHIKNFELLLSAGATLIPANPSFYSLPKTIEQVIDTVAARVLDHLGIPQRLMPTWQEESERARTGWMLQSAVAPRGKRQRTAALQAASRGMAQSTARQGLGVRLSSAAFESRSATVGTEFTNAQ